MTPVALGAWPNTEPLPTGKALKAQGVGGGAEFTYNNTVPARALNRGDGGALSHTFTVVRPVIAHMVAETIWRSPDAAWTGADWGIRISPADLDGLSEIHAFVQVYSIINYQFSQASGSFRLAPGTYTATVMWFSSPYGQNQVNYADGDYQKFHIYTAGEGIL
jgi:hypothetical protein